MTDSNNWYIEHFERTGSAIGYRITGKLDEVQSPFQKIEIFQTTDWGNLMTIDGAIMLTSKDNFFYHEMISHPVLFTHAAPKRVVIIGGGDCGTLREVLKHKGVESVTQCDIDEQVTVMARKHFPELCDSNDDARAALLFDDGVAYMANCPAGSVDVVIVDSTDPVGPGEGLFNKAFYESCFKALKDDGILVQQSESPLMQLDLINEMRTEQVIETKAQIVATACPYCLQMLADGVKTKAAEESLKVMDIAELVAQSAVYRPYSA